jgi:hypothetical protein
MDLCEVVIFAVGVVVTTIGVAERIHSRVHRAQETPEPKSLSDAHR